MNIPATFNPTIGEKVVICLAKLSFIPLQPKDKPWFWGYDDSLQKKLYQIQIGIELKFFFSVKTYHSDFQSYVTQG